MEEGRGQYFLLAGVLIVLMLTTVFTLTVMMSSRRSVQVEPQEEAELLISNIDAEISRFAEALIARATQDYFEGRARMDDVRRQAVDRVKAYTALLRESKLPVDFQLNIEVPEPITIGGVTIPPSTLEEAVERKSLIKIHGYSRSAIVALAFYYSITLDQPVIAVRNVVKKVYLKCDVLNVESTGGTYTITFHAETEEGNGTLLGTSSLWVLVREDSRLVWRNYNVTPTVVSWANGTYQVSINATVPYPEFYILRVVDDRGVTLEMSEIPYFRFQLRSRAFSSINSYLQSYGSGPSEVYTLEMLANGTLIWNFKKLPIQENVEIIPLPPIAVGNIRVNVTDPVTGETWVAPLQIEDWISPGTPNERPVSNPSRFIKNRGRLDSTDKLVFLVNFTNPDTGYSGEYRNVTIWWIRDPDLLVTPPIVTVDWDLSGLVNFSNGIYNMSVIVSRELIASYAVDYSMSIYYKDYHVEIGMYTLGYSELYVFSSTHTYTFPAGTKIIYGVQEEVLDEPTSIQVPAGAYAFKKDRFVNGSWVPSLPGLIPIARVYLESSSGTLDPGGPNERTLLPGTSIVLPADDVIYISEDNFYYWYYIWFPRFLPGGKPSNTLGWNLYNGTVRALLYRNSDVLYNGVSDYDVEGVLEHNETIIVSPGNYVVYRVQLKFLQDFTVHNYFSIVTIISGTSWDEGEPYRLQYYAYYDKLDNDVENGIYDYISSIQVLLTYTDKFYAQYRDSTQEYEPLLFGITTNTSELLQGLSTILIEDTGGNLYDYLWIWRSGDYNRRVLELDRLTYNPQGLAYTVIYSGSSADYNMVFWMGPGGSLNSGYESIYKYSDMFYYPPEVTAYEVSSG